MLRGLHHSLILFHHHLVVDKVLTRSRKNTIVFPPGVHALLTSLAPGRMHAHSVAFHCTIIRTPSPPPSFIRPQHRLRLCARLRYLWRGMPLYHELRVKWSVFHRLLALTNERLRYGTPGLATSLRRRQEHFLGYSNLLRKRGNSR